ncbi:hypothetical protein VE03_01655 [Pseudogymnoascus sp. 23342-1-I1]|nr:hypothetical protein VE03_01655 [Pseudogymnoascus sp. 23342-1-I1]
MSYSTTAFVHIIVIYATHGWNPPILGLDVLGIFLLAAVGVSMYPALVVSRRLSLATPLNNLKSSRENSNSEVACYLLDSTLLTSLAKLNGTRDLECTYECFLTRKSVMKTQDAVTVVWGSPMDDNVGNWGLTIGAIFSSPALLLKPANPVGNQNRRAIVRPIVYICLISMAPWIIMIEYSLRGIPVEEMSFAVGQWAPWAAALFAIIGGAILCTPGAQERRRRDRASCEFSDGLCDVRRVERAWWQYSNRRFACDRQERGYAASNQFAHLLDEIDLGTYRITPEPER